MVYPLTGSRLDNGGTNRTGVSLSTNIVIKVGNTAVGAIQTIQITEDRGIHMIDEIGNDGHIDSAPNRSTNISGTCSRVRFDRLRISEAFSRGFIHAHSQRYPFDIEIIDIQNASPTDADPTNSPQSIVTVIQNVWIKSISYQYQATDFIITDTLGFDAETIKSFFVGGNKNVATGGARSVNMFVDPIEQQADRGGRRGSMDAPGLINAFIGDAF